MAVEAFGKDGIGTNKHNLKNRVGRLYKKVCVDGQHFKNGDKTFLPKERKCMNGSGRKRNRSPPPQEYSPPSPQECSLGILDSQESLDDIINFSQSSQLSFSQLSQSQSCSPFSQNRSAKLRRVQSAVDKIQVEVDRTHSELKRMTNE